MWAPVVSSHVISPKLYFHLIYIGFCKRKRGNKFNLQSLEGLSLVKGLSLAENLMSPNKYLKKLMAHSTEIYFLRVHPKCDDLDDILTKTVPLT